MHPKHKLVTDVLTPEEQRTFTLRQPCTCCSVHCPRYHGLPEYPTQTGNPKLEALYTESKALGQPYYNTAEAGRMTEIFRLLTHPFNTYDGPPASLAAIR